MRIFLSRPSMRRPSRVPDAELPRNGVFAQQVFQVFQFSRTAAHRKVAILHNGDSSRVVSTIFERFQSAHDDGRRVARANVTEDSTHEERIAGEPEEMTIERLS